MSSTSALFECRRCHRPLRASEALEIVNVKSGALSWVCTPSSGRSCFGASVRPREVERIGLVGLVAGRQTHEPPGG